MLMLASGNLLKPSDGAPVTVPTQDMILGSYYLTTVRENDEGAGKVFRDENEALMAYAEHIVTLHAPIKVRRTMTIDGVERTGLVDATAGRIIFNNPIPQNLGYVDRTNSDKQFDLEIDFLVKKGQLSDIIERCIRTHGTTTTSEVLDKIKALGFKYSTKAAITVAVCDAEIPKEKAEILANADKQVEKINAMYRRGFISAAEKSKRFIQIWNGATDDVTTALKNDLGKYNPIFMMADSGARGSINQIRQLAEQSTKSAVDTRDLIEGSMQEIKEGNQAADSAAASIEIVVDGIGKIAESSRSISEISKDQANAMDQAEQGVNQISEVVQSNSATAEESSATSQELSAQAISLDELISKFILPQE